MKFAKLTMKWTLAIAVAVAPSVSLARGSMKVTTAMVAQLQKGHYGRAVTLARYGMGSAGLDQKVKAMAHGVGGSIMNDLVQGAIIMFVAATAQLAKDRLEKERLLAGHQIKYEDAKAATLQAAQDIFCSSKKEGASVSGEIACSGNFWVGFLGGGVARVGAQVTVVKLIQYLLSKHPTRAALINTVGSMATSFVMLGGFVMSGQLWDQALTLAAVDERGKINPEVMERGHNLFGRAVSEKVSGNWAMFSQTEEGKLAEKVFANMSNMLSFDSSLRSTWLYNGWRFGVARGELIVNVTVLMGAISAGATVGTAGATIAGLGGWTAAGISFLVATAFGLGVSYATVYFPDLEIGARLTDLIQSTRQYMNSGWHSFTSYQLDVAAGAFGMDRKFEGNNARYKQMWEQRMLRLLPSLRTDRQSWANVSMEKYYELHLKVEEAEAMIALIRDVISNSKVREQVLLKDGTTLISYREALTRYCPSVGRGGRVECEFPLSLQLKKLDQAQSKVREGRATLAAFARQILSVYDADTAGLKKILDDENLQFPPAIAEMLRTEFELADNTREVFSANFSAIFESIRQERNIQFDSDEQRKLVALTAKKFFSDSYTLGVNEVQITEGLLQASTAPASESSR